MLSYELCKKLKEAGFPQLIGENGTIYFSKDDGEFERVSIYEHPKMETTNKDICIPTLSELIESVIPDKADTHSFRLQLENNMWECAIHYSDSYSGSVTEFTPESAVASLWLELNKKV